MRKQLNKIWHRILVFLHLSPLSLAGKCRIAFGAAVALILVLALLIPYVWMSQLTRKSYLDAGRARSDALLANHFQSIKSDQSTLPVLAPTGEPIEPNDADIVWIRFDKEYDSAIAKLTPQQRDLVESLRSQQGLDETLTFTEQDDAIYSDYVRLFRARDSCMRCHNPQGLSAPFSKNQLIGAAVVRQPANQMGKTIFLNRIWIFFAGLIAAAGAIIAFYWITQRVILRPIRQLRALANNVSEGNLDIRSSINTRDEYERLAEAFNHMLDGLQAAQQKLRGANVQLDEKIAELSERNIELFKANKVKGEFLANISHEFRTPLNSILGFAEILREKSTGPNKEKDQRYAENIITAGKNLLNMINDLLDLAKTEAGKMQLHIEKTSVGELCDSLVASFSVMTKNKKIKVKLTVAEDIPPLNTDVGKVRQILYNFMSNSVKFTPERGRIEIRASMLDEKTLRIAVADTGCGIAPADQETIFDKFRQADGSITRRSAGTGLGLTLSKELANLLAGAVGLESELDKGSTFWLDIPVTLVPESNDAT
ncbi:MAG: ATP-binding protein [Phycisphaerales bacterium]|jgi:signal transduction histidine kinase